MNATQCNAIQNEMLAACQEVARRHNIKITSGGGRFTTLGTAKLRFDISTVATDGTVVDKPRVDFINYCHRYGLSQLDFGRQITFRGTAYVIAGLCPRRKRCPILVKPVGGGPGLLLSHTAVIIGMRPVVAVAA